MRHNFCKKYANLLLEAHILEYIIKFILERNLTNAKTVTNPSPRVQILEHIAEFIQEKDGAYVRNVENLLLSSQLFEHIRKFILRRKMPLCIM